MVQRGETLYSVATKHNVDVIELARLNKLKSARALREGQLLELPRTNK